MGHELPRRFVAVAAATPHKADPPASGCDVSVTEVSDDVMEI